MRICPLSSGVALISRAAQSASPVIRSVNARANRPRPDPGDHGQPGGQVGHRPAPGSGLAVGALLDAERGPHDALDLEPAGGGADIVGSGTP